VGYPLFNIPSQASRVTDLGVRVVSGGGEVKSSSYVEASTDVPTVGGAFAGVAFVGRAFAGVLFAGRAFAGIVFAGAGSGLVDTEIVSAPGSNITR
jgi:hypothetical protein